MRSESEGDTVDVEDHRHVQGGVEDGGRDGSDGAMDDASDESRRLALQTANKLVDTKSESIAHQMTYQHGQHPVNAPDEPPSVELKWDRSGDSNLSYRR